MWGKWVRGSVLCVAMVTSAGAAAAQDCINLNVKYFEEVTNNEGGKNHVFMVPRSEQLKMPRNLRMPELWCALTGLPGGTVQGNWYNLCASLESADQDYVYARCDGSGP